MPTVRRAAAAALSLAALGTASLPTTAGAADPPRLIKANRINGVTCVPAAGNTARADVRLWMSVVNYHGWGDWADHMEAKARLESIGPGIDIHSNWKASKTPYLTQDKRHLYNFRLITDNKSASAAWRLHVKLIWHRPAPIPNVTKDVYRPFDASCGLAGGFDPNPTPALPTK